MCGISSLVSRRGGNAGHRRLSNDRESVRSSARTIWSVTGGETPTVLEGREIHLCIRMEVNDDRKKEDMKGKWQKA